jgi:hypothetical protein
MRDLMGAKIIVGAVVVLVTASFAAYAEKIDPRLATVRRAWIQPEDELADDRQVAACLAEHLKAATPIEPVATKEEADVVFKVRANIPSATKRVLWGGMGGSPSAHLSAELPDGTKLWDDGAKLRRAIGRAGKLESSDAAKSVECGLADELLVTLRHAMRDARSKK